MGEFEVAVEQLGPDPENHVFEGSEAWWAARDGSAASEDAEGEGGGDAVVRPFRFRLGIVKESHDLHVTGDFDGEMSLSCSRCAKRYSQVLRDEFRLILSPIHGSERGHDGPAMESLDPESARGLAESGICLGEELEAGWFKGPVVRFGDFFGELVAMAIPLQPLCRQDCPGVCPHCGIDRGGSEKGGTQPANAQCGCEDEKIDSPFAVLAKLKR